MPADFGAGDDRDELARVLEAEDISGFVARVRSSLPHEVPSSPWVTAARQVLDAEPGLALGEYRRFLGLLMRGEGPLTPSKLVDEIWHQHILDSRNYSSFCLRIAGRYLHHDPSYGKPRRSHERCSERAKFVYKKHLGCDPPAGVWAYIGDSEGGGDGSISPPPPLYVVDYPNHVRAH